MSFNTSCNAKPTNPPGLDVLAQLVESGELKTYLVFALGTNGGWTQADLDEFSRIMADASDTKVVFVTSKTPENNYSASNELLSNFANSNDNYYLADWVSVYDESYFPLLANGNKDIHPAQNGGYEKWVEIISDALPQNCSDNIMLPGATVVEKIWNWFVAKKIDGVSDNPAVIAGILGNFYVESGFNPFMKGESNPYYGLYMLYGSYGGYDYVNNVTAAIGGNYFKFYGWWDDENTVDGVLGAAGLSGEDISKAIDINLQTLVDGDTWAEFYRGLKGWGVANTPEGISDLFLVTVERAVGGGGAIEDAAVRSHYSGSCQGAAERRAKARYIYDKYASSAPVNSSMGHYGTNSSGSGGGDNKNYAGDQVWSDGQMEAIEKGKPYYQTTATQYNIPWQLLAVVHSLESGLSWTNPGNGQGLYQLYGYTNGGRGANAFPGGVAVDAAEFQRQTNLAAEELTEHARALGADLNTDDGIKKILFAYNGRARQYINKALAMGFTQQEAENGEGSPYVMNRYDAKRDPNSSEMDPNWPGRFVADGVYNASATAADFGGFVKYIALGGGNGNAEVCPRSDASDYSTLIEYVLLYAWPEYHSANYLTMKSEYRDVVNKRLREGRFVGGGDHPGVDCGGFVTTVIQESGFDPDYNGSGYNSAIGYGQLAYLRDNPDKWQLVNSDWNVPISDESELSPGDIGFSNCGARWSCGHTYLYVGEIEGFETHIASASYSSSGTSWRTPMAGHEGIVGANINWFHKIK